ncbi:MAG: hypothetical protein WD572_00500 [Gammaproteobacteria bacterium]
MTIHSSAAERALHFQPSIGRIGFLTVALIALLFVLGSYAQASGSALLTQVLVFGGAVLVIASLLYALRDMKHPGPVLSIDSNAITHARHGRLSWAHIKRASVSGFGNLQWLRVEPVPGHGSAYTVVLAFLSGPIADVAPFIQRRMNEILRPKIHAELLADYERYLDDKDLPDATRILMQTTFNELTVIGGGDKGTAEQQALRHEQELNELRRHVEMQLELASNEEQKTKYRDFLMTIDELEVSTRILRGIDSSQPQES